MKEYVDKETLTRIIHNKRNVIEIDTSDYKPGYTSHSSHDDEDDDGSFDDLGEKPTRGHGHGHGHGHSKTKGHDLKKDESNLFLRMRRGHTVKDSK